MPVTLVIGGARSGKSSFAEKLANHLANNVAYIATGQALDAEMQERIRMHKLQRPKFWTTYEEPIYISKVLQENYEKHQVFLLDCVTLLISNIILDGQDIDNITANVITRKEEIVTNELNKFIQINNELNKDSIIVTNEIGLGLVPPTPLSRGYRDIVGRANQFLAKVADRVIVVWAGIPLQLKPELRRVDNGQFT